MSARRAHADFVDERLADWFAGQDADAVVERLAAAGVPAASVGSPSLVTDNEQLRFRGYFEPLDHPSSGPCEYPRPPFAPIAGTGGRWLRTPAPTLGQHTAEVLGRLCGVTDEELARLARAESSAPGHSACDVATSWSILNANNSENRFHAGSLIPTSEELT